MTDDEKHRLKMLLRLVMSLPLMALTLAALCVVLLYLSEVTVSGYTPTTRHAILAVFILTALPVDVLGTADDEGDT